MAIPEEGSAGNCFCHSVKRSPEDVKHIPVNLWPLKKGEGPVKARVI